MKMVPPEGELGGLESQLIQEGLEVGGRLEVGSWRLGAGYLRHLAVGPSCATQTITPMDATHRLELLGGGEPHPGQGVDDAGEAFGG